ASRRLDGHAKVTRHLARAFAILVVRHHPNGGKPLLQSDRRVLKDSPDLDRKLLMAVRCPALPDASAGEKCNFTRAATRALHAIRPAQVTQKAEAGIGILKVFDRFKKRF